MNKKVSISFLTLLLGVPLFVFAADVGIGNIAAFPMSFVGSATINGAPAPASTEIDAYYGDVLAGKVILQEAGVYGYPDPLKQQLLVGEGIGTIRFSAKNSALNLGKEISLSSNAPVFSFESGKTTSFDMPFSFTIPTSPGGGGGGGGGGSTVTTGGGGGSNSPASIPLVTLNKGISTPVLVQVPAPAPSYKFLRYLSRGVSGEDVRRLQEFLIKGGFLKGNATGFFGQLTESGVRSYQKIHGLAQVGSVGPKTRDALNAESGNGEVLGATTAMSNAELIAYLERRIRELTAELKKLLDAKAGLR